MLDLRYKEVPKVTGERKHKLTIKTQCDTKCNGKLYGERDMCLGCVCVCVCPSRGGAGWWLVMEEMTSELRVAGTWSLSCLLTYLCRCLRDIQDLLTGMGVVQFPQVTEEL